MASEAIFCYGVKRSKLLWYRIPRNEGKKTVTSSFIVLDTLRYSNGQGNKLQKKDCCFVCFWVRKIEREEDVLFLYKRLK
ncbi:MAG: hypothetical protein D8M18_06665 [Bacteroidetes bacterium]|nr:hypothetical protein [Bacteroidota bacterium]